MPRPLLLASLGNPGPAYAGTRHSAGHLLLASLARHASAPPLHSETGYANGPTSHILLPDGTTSFWQSPALMNVSGKPVATAWRTFQAFNAPRDSPANVEGAPRLPNPTDLPHLVVIHDELELSTGQYKIKTGQGASARGHNGLKSILDRRGMRDLEFTRVGVGIGPRPLSRETSAVSTFVLGRMSAGEMAKIDALAPRVWADLQALRSRQNLGGSKGGGKSTRN